MSEKWYSRRYRRHLCDMHIDGWDERFLSKFSPEVYVDNLIKAKVNAPMLYLQSFSGLCYFPTKCGAIHPAFEKEPDRMRRLVNLCHENGMSVVGYYSLSHNTWAHDVHPEWRMLEENGKSVRENKHTRYGFCCPNNPDYREFVFEQIKEMLDYFDVDGMFYDMPFWPQVCRCEHCRTRWAQEVGGEIPDDENDLRWETLLERRRAWMSEWSQAVTDCTKAIRSEVTVEQNYASAVDYDPNLSISDEVNEACDYTGGDLYGGGLEQSFTCKYYMAVTRNQPFEYMTCRCTPNLNTHTLSKTKRDLRMAVQITCAHSGASLLIDAIDPIGTMNEKVYKLFGEVYEEQIPYEKYFGGEMLKDIGVIYDLPSKALRHGQKFNNHHAALQAVITLTKRHVPVGVSTYRQMDSLSQYPVLIAPLLHTMSEKYIDALVGYVENGGKLYFSGAEQKELIERLLGGKLSGFTEHTTTYLAPRSDLVDMFEGFDADYPLPYESCVPKISDLPTDADVMAAITLPYTTQGNETYAAIHSNPPGVDTDIPAVVRRRVGKGEVIWCAMPIEKEPLEAYENILMNLLNMLGLSSRVQTDAPKVVEIVTFEQDGDLRVSEVRLGDEYDGILPACNVRVKTERKPERVLLLPEETEVGFNYADGWTCFEMKELDMLNMYKICMNG